MKQKSMKPRRAWAVVDNDTGEVVGYNLGVNGGRVPRLLRKVYADTGRHLIRVEIRAVRNKRKA